VGETLEKLFRGRSEGSKGTTVPLSNAFREGEMIFAMDIDMLKTQWS